MSLQSRVTDILAAAVENKECAGANVLVRRCGEEILYTQAGMADVEARRYIQRNSIFRLFSQSKPVTSAAVMLLAERGVLDLMEPVETYLPGFAKPRVWTRQGLIPAQRSVRVMDLLGMTAGLCYPDADEPGQYAAAVFNRDHELIRQGGGMTTLELCNTLGRQPLAFHPGKQFRYSTCADVLGAVVEVASGRSFGEFLQEEFFEPLGMKDTAFWVPEEKRDRFVTAYETDGESLKPWLGMNLAVGVYDRPPAFESGGAGLVSTLEDYAAFAQMLLNGGSYEGKQILSPATVRCMTSPQLSAAVQETTLWETLAGYSYGKLLRVCTEPGRYPGLAVKNEYGWGGWLGTDFFNFPDQQLTILLMQNVHGRDNGAINRRVRNAVLAELT